MRRFVLTYQREGSQSIAIEGVQFSDGVIALELYPDNEWCGTREFRSLQSMEYAINEFGETSINWLDEEKTESDLHYPPNGSYLAPDAIHLFIDGIALVSPIKEVQP